MVHALSILIALIPAAVLVFGVKMFIRARRIDLEIQKDKFNRTNRSGIMEFDTFEDVQAAAKKAGTNGAKIVISLLLIVAGAGFLISVLVQWTNATSLSEKDLREVSAACEAAWEGPMGSDLEPCRRMCESSDYKDFCRRKFGWEDGPKGGPQ